MDALVIDAFEFCRLGERREGRVAVADLPRLSAECVDTAVMLEWTLQGGIGALGYPRRTMSVSAAVQLVCQRCLLPFSFEMRTESVLFLASSEQQADEIEDQLGDEEIDVIVGSKAVAILDLIEDDALLALPLSPRHEVCPGASALEVLKEGKPSPFAALKKIRQ